MPPDVVEQVGVDALKPETYKGLLEGARSVVISIGEAPWSERTGGTKERAIEINGHANVAVMKAAAECKVPRIVLVNATMPTWGLIEGYREGKELAEAEARAYPEKSGLGSDGCSVLVLKPSVVSGTKYWGSVPLPFGVAMGPMRFTMRCLSGPCAYVEEAMPRLAGGVLRPPVRVDELANAVADMVQAEASQGIRVLDPEHLVGYESAAAASAS